MKRRDFLRNSALLASGTYLVPAFIQSVRGMSMNFSLQNLVIVQLSGGNDGLNTIVPFSNDIYYRKRKTIAIKPGDTIRLSDMQGFNPSLLPLKEIYDQGWMTIINDVGYPNPDRSHFRSMDIWHSGSESDEFLSTGWIGRYLDSNCQSCKNAYAAIEVDSRLSLAMQGVERKGLAIKSPEEFYKNTKDPFFKSVLENSDFPEHGNLGYMYKTLLETSSSAEYIAQKVKLYKSTATYPNTGLANQLKTVSRLICSGMETRVYYVSLSGFDTHINQIGQQGNLLKQYSEAISVFLNELKMNDRLEDTIVMTFSEFGRRVQQNASNGTDHGTANNVFLFGGKLKSPGIFNDSPDLSDLDSGDLKYKVDFRNIYATILKNWLGNEDPTIFNKSFSHLGII